MRTLLLGLAIAALMSGSATAEEKELASQEEAVALAEKIMDRIVAEDIDGAFELARPFSSMAYGEFNAFARHTTETFKARPPTFGEPLGYLLLERETAGDAVLRVAFLQKFRNRPLGWEFFFYRAENTWWLLGFGFFGDERLLFDLPPRGPAPAAGPAPGMGPG